MYYPATLPENPCEIKISDNQIMNWNDRDTYMPAIYNVLNGLEYYINDFSSIGITWYELCDRYNVQIGSNTYSCVLLNDEIDITQGLEELIHTDMPEESQTDYSKADKTDRRINQTTLTVDKQNQKISSLITQIGDRSQKTTSITQDIDTIASRVENITDLTRKVTAYTTATLEEVAKGNAPLKLRIFGNNVFGTYESIRFQNGLYFQDGLYFGANQGSSLKINNKVYVLGFNDVLRQLGDVYDEYVYDYSQGQAYIIRRIELDENDNMVVRENEVIENLSMPDFVFDIDGNNTITLAKNANFEITYMVKNNLTDSFASKVYMKSEINQTARQIQAGVTEQITDATGEINENIATLTIKSNAIEQEVSQKTGELEENVASLGVRATNIEGTVTQNYTSLDGRLTTAEATILVQAGQILAKLDSSDFTSATVIGLINNRDGTSSALIQATNINLNGAFK